MESAAEVHRDSQKSQNDRGGLQNDTPKRYKAPYYILLQYLRMDLERARLLAKTTTATFLNLRLALEMHLSSTN